MIQLASMRLWLRAYEPTAQLRRAGSSPFVRRLDRPEQPLRRHQVGVAQLRLTD